MMMWRLFIISAAAWQASSDSSSNTVSRSWSKFPVQLEADTGAPKQGEGEGGVAVLLKPMPEATTMKTWSFLKESMLKIGDQVRQIMQVRNDMSMLQQDLNLQQKLWHNAEIELNQENAKLRAQVESLKIEERQGSNVRHELLKVKQLLEDQQRRNQDLTNQAEKQEKTWQMEVQFLDARKSNVTALHKEVNQTASKEISRAEGVHLQLQKDAATLRLAIGDFQDRLKNGQEKMEFENSKSLAQQAELQRQIAAMKEGLKRIEGKLQPRAMYDSQEAQLKQSMAQETQTILHLQAEHQQIVTECTKKMQEQDSVKCAEEAKLRSRIAEKTQFCNAIQVQTEVLKQDLAKCGMLVGISNPNAAPAAQPLPPLAQPLPVRDEERMMSAGNLYPAPAPAPLPGYMY